MQYNRIKGLNNMNEKKLAPFFILEILKEKTDTNHKLRQSDIIVELENYGIEMERKTIASTIDMLNNELNYSIEKDSDGYYLSEREFDETEIKFLIDAIYSSKIITGKQANKLSKKLYSFLSKYQQKNYNYTYKSTDVSRAGNIDFFFNIDIINEAIAKNKKISFCYLSYDSSGNQIRRKNGYRYLVSPYYLINNSGKYYLLCNYDKYNELANYKVDYIVDIKLEDEDRKKPKDVKGLGDNFKISDYINDHIYMFGGDVITAKIRIDDKTRRHDIKDWFGTNVSFKKEGDIEYALVRSEENALFYWLLQYQEHFTLVEPISLIDKITKSLELSLKKYTKLQNNTNS